MWTKKSVGASFRVITASWISRALFALIAIGVGPVEVSAHAPGVVLSGVGTAIIDGRVSFGEWQNAACREFLVNVPEGGTTPGLLCAMNDETNIYFLVRFQRPSADPGNTASIEFDNDHDGIQQDGDDVLLLDPTVGFFDECRSTRPPCPAGALCGFIDTDLGGTNDGAGAFANDGVFTTYEFSHPLDSSDDSHDFSITTGSVVGFRVFIRLIGFVGTGQRIADTDFPQFLFGDFVATTNLTRINIDIKPGSAQNSVNRRSHGKIPVAILSTPEFDAASQVNVASLTFGSTGNEPSLAFCHAADVNGDGLLDLMCHFHTQAASFRSSDSQGVLKGTTVNGTPFEGADAVRIVR